MMDLAYTTKNTTVPCHDISTEILSRARLNEYESFLMELEPVVCLTWICYRYGYSQEDIGKRVLPLYGYRAVTQSHVAHWIKRVFDELKKRFEQD